MDTRLLRSFVELAGTGHYGRAAERLHITQSTLSKQIRALEHAVGGVLLERGRHGAKLTALGELLLTEAHALLRHFDEVDAKMRGARAGLSGHLDVAFGVSTLDIAPRRITSFRQAVPDCQITLNDMASKEQHERILSGRLDLGFCRAPDETGETEALAFLPVLTEHLAVIVPPGTETPAPPDLSALNRLGFVMLTAPRGPGLDYQIGRWCQSAGFTPRVIQHADDVLTIHAVVAAGLGAAFFPWAGAAALGGGTKRVKLTGPASRWEVGLCWRKAATDPLLERFIDHATAAQTPGRGRAASGHRQRAGLTRSVS